MTLLELQEVLGKRIELATDTKRTPEEKITDMQESQTIASLAKQMINNADVILRAEKFIKETGSDGSNIQKLL